MLVATIMSAFVTRGFDEKAAGQRSNSKSLETQRR